MIRFRLSTLLLATLVSSLVLSWLLKAGMFTPDYEKLNQRIIAQLDLPVSLETKGWKVEDLARYIENQFEIPVTYENVDPSRLLDDISIENVRLKNVIRLTLWSRKLTYIVKRGQLVILPRSQARAEDYVVSVYSNGDLVIPTSVARTPFSKASPFRFFNEIAERFP